MRRAIEILRTTYQKSGSQPWEVKSSRPGGETLPAQIKHGVEYEPNCIYSRFEARF